MAKLCKLERTIIMFMDHPDVCSNHNNCLTAHYMIFITTHQQLLRRRQVPRWSPTAIFHWKPSFYERCIEVLETRNCRAGAEDWWRDTDVQTLYIGFAGNLWIPDVLLITCLIFLLIFTVSLKVVVCGCLMWTSFVFWWDKGWLCRNCSLLVCYVEL